MDSSVPWESATVRVVLLSTVLATFSVALISPGLPVFRGAFDLTDAEASLLLTALLVPGIFLSPVMGLLTDRLGRRRVLVSSLLVWSLAGGAIAIRPTFPVVLALWFVQGVTLAGIGITTVTLVGDVFEGAQRNAVLGANTAVLSAGAAAFPLVGGALATVAWNAPFAMYLLGVPVALTTPFLIAVATVGYGAGWGLVLPSIDAGVSDIVPPQFRAGALSLRNSASFLGRAAGPVLFTALAAGSGYRVLLLAAGVSAFAFGGLLLLVRRG